MHEYAAAAAAVCRDFLVTPLEARALYVDFSNIQVIFITIKYFWPHFEKQDGHYGRFSTFSKEFCWPPRTKGIIGRNLKFTGYVHHYKILTENIFGLILKKQDGHHGRFILVMKRTYNSLIIGPGGLKSETNL